MNPILALAGVTLLLLTGCSSNRQLVDVSNSKNSGFEESSIINNGIIGDTNIITNWLYHSYVIAVDGTPLPRFAEEKKDFLGLTTEANLDYSVKVSPGSHELIISVDFERGYAPVFLVKHYIGICKVSLQEGHEYIVRSKSGREIDQVVIDLTSDQIASYCNEMIKASSDIKYHALKGFLSTRRVDH